MPLICCRKTAPVLKVHTADLSPGVMMNVSQVAVTLFACGPLIVKIRNHRLQNLLMLNAVAVVKHEQVVAIGHMQKFGIIRQDIEARLILVKQVQCTTEMASHRGIVVTPDVYQS